MLPQLPNELHLHYASYLNGQSIFRLSKTCKALRAVFRDEAQRIIKHVEADALTYDHYWDGVRVPEDHPDILVHVRDHQNACTLTYEYELNCDRHRYRQRLEDAVREGKGEEIPRFLEAGLMPTVRSRGLRGPLLHGVIKCQKAFREDITTLRLLLEVGARPNALDYNGRTALDAGRTFDPSPAYAAWLELWEYLESLEAIEPDLQSLQEEAVQLSFDDIMNYHPAVAVYMEVIDHPRIDDLANT